MDLISKEQPNSEELRERANAQLNAASDLEENETQEMQIRERLNDEIRNSLRSSPIADEYDTIK